MARLMLRSVADAGDVCLCLTLTRSGTMARVELPRSSEQSDGQPDSGRLLPLSHALRTAVRIANRIGADVTVIPARDPPAGDGLETRQ